MLLRESLISEGKKKKGKRDGVRRKEGRSENRQRSTNDEPRVVQLTRRSDTLRGRLRVENGRSRGELVVRTASRSSF